MVDLESIWDGVRPDRLPLLTTIAEYRGESAIAVSATQLDPSCTRTQATRIVAEWVDFLAAGPSPITELHLVSRTPERLFAALAGQSQLRRLFLKWGDYEDLSVLVGMTQLEILSLGASPRVRSVAPLADLRSSLARLQIESLRDAHDMSPLAELTGLTHLELGGDWISPRIAHINSIAWLGHLPDLRHLLLQTIVVDDLDYTPLLRLKALAAVRVMKARRMRPAHEDLKAQLPWSE